MQLVTISKHRLSVLHHPRTLVMTRQAIVCLVIAAMFTISVHAGSPPGTSSRLSEGFVAVTGTVRINGQTAMTGQTLFASSRVITSEDSAALLSLENSSRWNLSADSDLTIDTSSKTISGSLTEGQVSGSVPAGVLLEFRATDVSIVSDAAEAVVFSIQTNECAGTNIMVDKGRLEARVRGQLRTIKAGESLSTNLVTQSPQTTPSSNRKKKLGILIGIGTAVAVLLAVALAKNDEVQESPGGGCVIVLSPGATGCH